MNFNIQEIIEASSEVVSELLLTSILVLILIGLGIILGLWSRRRHYNRPHEFTDRVGFRQRIRRPLRPEVEEDDGSWFTEFLQGVSTEMVGAVVTTLLFGIIMLIFQQYQSTQERRNELALQMGSPVNIFAVEAARQLGTEGWLYDGSIQGVDLSGTNLNNADLASADLQRANFTDASLRDTNFSQANLSNARLVNANLNEAIMNRVNLTNAQLFQARFEDANVSDGILIGSNLTFAHLLNTDLRRADIRDANLRGANLQGADLEQADLRGADLSLVKLQAANLRNVNLQNAIISTSTGFSIETVLPDARSAGRDNNNNTIYSSYWSPDTDMTRFTDPEHPEFWNPCEELTTLPWYCERES